MRHWTGLALLSVSWLLGLHYFAPARPVWWVAAVLAAVVCLGGVVERLPSRRESGVALVLFLLPAWCLPWPWRMAPLLAACGVLVGLSPVPARWPRWLARGAVAAGSVLAIQALALITYAARTARGHELPGLLRTMVAGVARLLGADVAESGGDLVFRVLNEPHRLAATWELLLDPATLAFYVGGLALLAVAAWERVPAGSRWAAWLRAARALSVVAAAWLPVRVGLAMALYVNRAMLAGADAPPLVMGQFFSPWFHLLLLAGPALLAARFVPWPGGAAQDETSGAEWVFAPAEATSGTAAGRFAVALALVAAGAGCITAAVEWTPVGRPKAGRVMVVERHSLWEPTTRAYDTTWYGEPSGYNYAGIYGYCGHYFEMSRLLESDAIDDARLAECDVLIIKTPTARYSPQEAKAIGRFVEGGGGLLLIGDHTNVFRSSTYLNDVARQFGFTYRHDLLFRIGSPYQQRYERPLAAHPAVQDLPPVDFAVSCSIDPGTSPGRAAICSTGLWSLPSAYQADNYHPQAEYRPEMRYGAFVQLWATTHGRGRVLAFTDSTIFSNFCVFQPGKAELFLGMVHWLNYSSALDQRWAGAAVVGVLALAGLVLAASGEALAWLWRAAGWLSWLAAALTGVALATLAVTAAQRSAMPPPEPLEPLSLVVIDRTTSEAPLANGAFNKSPSGFGLLEQTIPRLGFVTMRRSGLEAVTGDAVVVICPTRSVPDAFRERLEEYVAEGGRLLVIDSPVSEGSTANSLLWPFGLGTSHAEIAESGEFTVSGQSPGVGVEAACKVSGGEAFARLGGVPVGALARHGKGAVAAVGFGHVFSDGQMGEEWLSNWMPAPDATTLAKYELFYAVFRGLMRGGPVELSKSPGPKPKTPEAPGAPEAPDVPEAPLIVPPSPKP